MCLHLINIILFNIQIKIRSKKNLRMQPQQKWSNNKQLLVKLAENFKLLEDENQQLRKQLQANKQQKLKGVSKMAVAQISQKTNNNQKYQKDQQKILKLYSYKSWEEFMTWIDEKLEESGETISNQELEQAEDKEDSEIKRVLSEILEQPDFEQSYTMEKPEQKASQNTENENEAELLAVENAKLRRENIQLKSKLTEIKALYMKNYKNEYFST